VRLHRNRVDVDLGDDLEAVDHFAGEVRLRAKRHNDFVLKSKRDLIWLKTINRTGPSYFIVTRKFLLLWCFIV